MQVQVDVLTTHRSERDLRGRLDHQSGDHPVVADGGVGAGRGIRLRSGPVVLQHEPVVVPAAARLLAPLDRQPDALLTDGVVESAVGATATALGYHEWCRSPGPVRR